MERPEERVEVLRADEHLRMPWKNGGGVTSEVARFPAEGEFDWRISIAEVAEGGPFSAFPEIDRVILRLGEAPLVLRIEGAEHELQRFQPLAFDGEAATTASLPGGPTRDLNVMTRRGRAVSEVIVHELVGRRRVGAPAGNELIAIVLDGVVDATVDGESTLLELHDGLHGIGPVAFDLDGAATVVVAALRLLGDGLAGTAAANR